MTFVATGLVALIVSVLLFRLCLPRGNKPRWFIGTEYEAYIVVGVTFLFGLSIGLVATSIIDALT
jgi:hypothetical protein